MYVKKSRISLNLKMDQSEAYLVYVTYLVSISLSFQPMKQCLDSFLCYCELNLEYKKSRSK